MNFLVGAAGFLNAGGIALQAVQLAQTKDPTSISVPMFGMFLFIQAVFTARGIQNKDWMMAGGMLLSALATVSVITLVIIYR